MVGGDGSGLWGQGGDSTEAFGDKLQRKGAGFGAVSTVSHGLEQEKRAQ